MIYYSKNIIYNNIIYNILYYIYNIDMYKKWTNIDNSKVLQTR